MPITSFGREARANTTVAGNQVENGIAALQGGGYVVVWTDGNTLDGSDAGIFMQRYDASGTMVGGETRVNTTTQYSQNSPSVTGFADGSFVVAWSSYNASVAGFDIYFQRYDNAGNALGPETQANSITSNHQYMPSLTELASGGFVITWQSETGGDIDIYMRRFDASGNPIGTDTLVNTTVTANQHQPNVLSLDDGGFVVSWTDETNDGSNYGIYFQRYDNAGNPAGPETRANTYTLNGQIEPTGTRLADGGFVLLWTSYGQDGSGYGVYFQRFDNAGSPVGLETRANSGTGDSQIQPSVTPLPDGGFAVMWREGSQKLVLQRFDASGLAIGQESTIPAEGYSTSTYRSYPEISLLSDGNLAVSWLGGDNDGNDYNIYSTIIDFDSPGMTTGRDVATGASGSDIFIAAQGTLTQYDKIDGGDGIDTLRLTGGGAHSLVGVSMSNIERIELSDAAGTTLTVVNAAQAMLVATAAGAADKIILGSGAFSLAQRRALFDLGVETLTDAQGTYQSTNAAPVTADDTVTRDENDYAPILVLANDTDGDGDPLSIVAGSLQVTGYTTSPGLVLPAPGGPSVSISDLQTWFFINGGGISFSNYLFNFLDPDQSITVTLTYQVTDGVSNVTPANLTVTLTGSLEAVSGGVLSDLMSGTAFGDLLRGLEGDDTLSGLDGNDTLFGDDGDDTLYGGTGNDILWGGTSDDLLEGGSGNDTLNGDDGMDTLRGGSGDDALDGGAGSDLLEGGSGHDRLAGGADDDRLYGGDGTDTLSGDDGDDALYGNAGNDLLRGGLGSDALTGGTGKDLFYFTAAELTDGAVDTVLDGGISTNDLIRVDGVPYYKLGVSAIAGGARISFEGVDGFIDVKGIGNNPVVVATSQTVAGDYTQLNADSRANVQINYVDFANSQIWSHYNEIYNAAGQMTGQFGRYDGNGGSWEFRYDPAGTEPTYDTRFSYFNAAGELVNEVGTYDAPVAGNTRYIVTFDPDNTQLFTSSITYYDALDRPTQVQAFYDDGGSGVTTFDAADTQAFDYYTTYYDAQGRAEQTNGVYDGADGSFFVQYDKDEAQPWQSLTVTYDQAGTVTQQWYTMDNGAIVYI